MQHLMLVCSTGCIPYSCTSHGKASFFIASYENQSDLHYHSTIKIRDSYIGILYRTNYDQLLVFYIIIIASFPHDFKYRKFIYLKVSWVLTVHVFNLSAEKYHSLRSFMLQKPGFQWKIDKIIKKTVFTEARNPDPGAWSTPRRRRTKVMT